MGMDLKQPPHGWLDYHSAKCTHHTYDKDCVHLLNISLKHTHTHPFNGPLSRTTQVGRYQKGKTNLDFTTARDSEWQWHQLGQMQVCTSLQTDNHASTPLLVFLQTGCTSCCPTNSVKALKANFFDTNTHTHTRTHARTFYLSGTGSPV